MLDTISRFKEEDCEYTMVNPRFLERNWRFLHTIPQFLEMIQRFPKVVHAMTNRLRLKTRTYFGKLVFGLQIIGIILQRFFKNSNSIGFAPFLDIGIT